MTERRTAGTLIDNAIEALTLAADRIADHPSQDAAFRLKRAIAAAREVKSALPAGEESLSATETEAETEARLGKVEAPAQPEAAKAEAPPKESKK